MSLRARCSPGPGYSGPQSCLLEVEAEEACRVKVEAVVAHHPSLVRAGEEGGPLVQRAEEVVVVVVVPFQAMEEVAGDQQTLQIAVEEVAAGAGTG